MIIRRLVNAIDRRLSAVVNRGPRPAILMYHRIADERFDPWGLAVSPASFDGQMRWLQRNRAVLSLDEFAQAQAGGAIARDAIAITFDDGYACVASAAAPILERLGLPATIFVPAGLLGRQYWWDELAQLLLGFEGDKLSLAGREIDVPAKDDGDRSFAPGSAPRTGRQMLFIDLWRTLRTQMAEEIEAALAPLRTTGQAAAGPRSLTASEIAAVRSEKVSVGSHALTHPSLPALDDAQMRREIFDSVAQCAELTGVRPQTFAYPFGDHDARSKAVVRDAGFACACATGDMFVTPRSDLFALPRLQVGDWPIERFAAMLGGQ